MTAPRPAPVALLFGGAIGAGKTTLRRALLARSPWRRLAPATVVDAGEPGAYGQGPHGERSSRAAQHLQQTLDRGAAVLWEATFGWQPAPGEAPGAAEARWLEALRQRGYRICFHAVVAPSEALADRVAARVAAGGRGVDAPQRITRSAELFATNLALLRACADRFTLWSNDRGLRPVPAQGQRQARRTPAQRGGA